MKMALLVPDAEPTRFEIRSIPSRSHHHDLAMKWFMRASNHEEADRWKQAISMSIERYNMREGKDSDAFPYPHPTSDLPNLLARPFIFTGSNDLDSWVNELNDYFSKNDCREAEKLPMAIEHLSPDVQSAIMRVLLILYQAIDQQDLIGDNYMNLKVLKMDDSEEGQWGGQWSWLVGLLRGMKSEDFLSHTVPMDKS